MAVADTTLIDLTDLTSEERTLLGIPTMTDGLLEKKMDEASDWIENETGSTFIVREIEDEEHLLDRVLDVRDCGLQKVFLNSRPITELTTVTDPDGNELSDSDLADIGIQYGAGILTWNFWPSVNSTGIKTPWKFAYSAGRYADRDAVPPALKNAVKLVLAWRWRITPEMYKGDSVPNLISQALEGFYSANGPWG